VAGHARHRHRQDQAPGRTRENRRTDGYVKLAEDHGGDLGTPFGPLPANVLNGPGGSVLPSGPFAARLEVDDQTLTTCQVHEQAPTTHRPRIVAPSVPIASRCGARRTSGAPWSAIRRRPE
jgi:hypothetical protein